MSDALSPKEGDDLLAAEFVLGVLDLAERSAAEARLRHEPAFAALVAEWENRLGGLNEDFAEVPAPALLGKIETRLFPQAKHPRISLWRWLPGMAVATALVLVGLATLLPPKLDLVAVLASADNRLAYEVRSFGASLRVERVAGQAATAGSVHELWVIAPDSAPVSLGLLGDDSLLIPYQTPPAGWVLAVSVEPEGGSPTGQPTGPVILMAEVTSET